ncbi:uncharacterized protein FA14DRAFT_161661 [Meira miltonrushii]|uniref:PX domain-containing protein n=1 Tax=Meira miltonrushii TaxID=1280837 RepID=A0A316V9M7_9BASI|nr:uncharacterized protein FA14DRAFT_161661 [Meira miltonrushii]PWN34162.1 hypothetical protein FA14DRAFT_161661 [Meira miltonrushii]
MSAARRAFSLSLKSKPLVTKEEGENTSGSPIKPPKSPLRSAKASTSQHPLADQQQKESRQPSSSTSSSHLSASTPDTSVNGQNGTKSSKDASIGSLSSSDNSGPSVITAPELIGRKRTPSDASTGMQATSSWFNSAVTDEEDDDENDEPVSPADTDWDRDSSSLLERAKEALASSEHYQTKTELKMPERPFLQDIVERGRTKEFSGEDVGNKSTPTSQSPHKNKEPKSTRRAETLPNQPDGLGGSKDAKLQRSTSKSAGILGRLKRISRREKRASTMDEKLREGPFSVLSTPAEVKDASGSDEKLTSSPGEEDATVDAKMKHSRRKSDLPIQDASRERTIEFGGVQRVHSIHSVQPSLVDDESIAGRDSPPGSPLGSDEQWQEADLAENDLLSNIPTINEEMGITSSQDQKAPEKDDWHLTSIPGSFIVQQDNKKTELPTQDLPALEDLKIQEPVEEVSGTAKKGEVEDVPDITIDSPAENDTAVHQQEKSEYTQALSRQTSDFGSSSSSDFLIATPAFTPSEGVTEEDDAATPRAVAEPNRTSYFDAPSVISPPLQITTNAEFAPLTHEDTWLDKIDLAHEERHYLIRHMVNQQMRWELDRLYLVKGMDYLERPSPPNVMPKSDLAYLKLSPGQITPDLPIVRILIKHVLSTFPLFSAATPIEGAAAMRTRLTNASQFMDRGVLPLLRFLHSNSISKAVDLNGEWQDEMSDAPSTLDRMGSAIFKLTSRFITALADGKGHGFLWSKVPSPAEASFFAHRKPFNMLKQGGSEVNVVSSRLRTQARECDFILSVHRYGFPAGYVIRSESDFYNYAITLAQELGPQARVRPVPAPDADLTIQPLMEDDESLLDGRSASSSPTKDMLGTRRASIRINKVYKSNDGSSSSTSSLQNLSSPITSSLGGAPMSRDHVSHDSGVPPTRSPVLSKKSPIIPQNKSTISLTSQHTKATSKRRSIDAQKSPINHSALTGSQRSGSRIFSASRPALKNSSTTDVSILASLTPITTDEESRRKQVRAWLRDTLSIRGAGHAKQTKSFLENDAFLERDLKPGSRADVQSRREVDEAEMETRKQMIEDSSRDVIELRQEMNQLWRECVEGNGFERALSAVQQNTTFSALPLPYQRVISWTNLQIAQFLHQTFLDSHEARQNFDRFQEAISCIPWKLLSLALRERTGWMMQQVQSCFLDEFVQKKIMAIMLQDVPERKLDIEIEHLRERLGTTVMKKLEVFSKSSTWQKQIVRRAAQQADIPLVAAIMRGSDKPLLSAEGIKKVVSATKHYQEFIRSQPTYAEKKAKLKANVDVRRIYDMQHALRLLCQKRDGKKIREGLKAELKPIVFALLQPLLDLLKRLHKSKLLIHSSTDRTSDSSASSIKSSKDEKRDVVLDLQQFCLKLLDVLAGLRMRVQDPSRSLSTLTLLLDDAVPDWYRFLHASSLGDSLLYDFTQWLQSVASLLRFKETGESGGATDDILARFWAKPSGEDKSPLQAEGTDRAALEALVEHAWRKRTRQMEMGCRWATGDADGNLDIQLMGEGGKTRMTAYEMKKQKLGPTVKVQSALEKLLPGFRAGLDRVLTADPGTAW